MGPQIGPVRSRAFTLGLLFRPWDPSWSRSWGSSASRSSFSADCKFTCHYRCRALVCLDCCGPRDLGWEPALERDTNVVSLSPGVQTRQGHATNGPHLRRSLGLARLTHKGVLTPDFPAAEWLTRAGSKGCRQSCLRADCPNHPDSTPAQFPHLSASGPEATLVHMRTRTDPPTRSSREVSPAGGAELSCPGDEIIPGGEARVAPPLKVPPPMRREQERPCRRVSALTVAALTLVPAHAHTDRARAWGGGWRLRELRAR